MGKNCKHFLVLLLAALLMFSMTITGFAEETAPEKKTVCYDHGDVNGDGAISDQDAIYVLYSTFPMFKDTYPVYQDVDLNEDGVVNTMDAIYLLYAAFHMTGYDLDGTVHNYFDPVWTWTEAGEGMTASVAFRCGCGEDHGNVSAEVTCETREATCVTAGYKKYTATVVYDGVTYQADKTVELTAGSTGHVIGEPTCTQGAKCANCDYEIPALGHQFALTDTQPATCQSPAVETWTCVCGETKTVILDAILAHTYKYVENGDVLYASLEQTLEGVEYSECLWVKHYACADCGQEKVVTLDDTYHKHSFTVTLTTEPTCVSGGVKTYRCADCGYHYTENIAANADAHAWNSGVTENGVTTYTCSHNSAHTKTSVAMTASGLTADTLAGSEVVLNQGTTVALDDAAVEALEDDKNIVISVVPADVSGILSQDQKEQIAGNTVYDFTMRYDDGTAVSNFAGEVTVSLPYTLKEGDDIDSIDVWFLDAAGNPTQMKGTYANGFVIFTTNHFSYYTVTRLTPAERCARYGHISVDSAKEATCTEDGYNMTVCHRCGEQLVKTVIAAPGHSYVRTETAAACDQDGTYKDVCSVCGHTVNGEIPALGHALELDESRSTGSTCASAGKNTYVCTKEGCGYEKVEELAQLEHSYTVTETVADCTTNGSKVRTCSVCGTSEVMEATAALGHDYKAETAVWTWNDALSAATVTLTCGNDETHTETLTAVVTKTTEGGSCAGGGTITYTARASFNKVLYSDVKTVTMEVVEHQPGTNWVSNASQHYRECALCQAQLDAADHIWDEGTVTKAATCKDAGTIVYTCEVCGYEKTMTLDATGKHTYYYGYCTVCGYAQGSCTHVRLYHNAVNLYGYKICGTPEIEKVVCSCGQNGYISLRVDCEFQTETILRTAPDGTQYEVYTGTCINCGLTFEEYTVFEMLEGQCAGSEMYYTSISMNGKTIAATKYCLADMTGGVQEHPARIEKKTVDLTQYGMCEGAELVTMACPCGEREFTYLASHCEWENNDEDQTDTAYSRVCLDCGAVMADTWTTEKLPGYCIVTETGFTTVTMNGLQIASYESEQKWTSHKYKVDKYTVCGTTCEDGVHVFQSCTVCGVQDEVYVESHYQTTTAEYDVGSKGLCFDTLVQSACLCGLKEQGYWEDGEKYCRWQVTSEDDTTGTTVYTCSVCGATKTCVRTTSNKNANCYVTNRTTATYRNAAGAVVATVYDQHSYTEHDMKVTGWLLGSNCTAGVQITFVCKDCGEKGYSNIEYGHVGLETKRYKLEGSCFGDVVLYSCLCGQEKWYDFEDATYNWTQTDWESLENGYRYTEMCQGCGISKTETAIKLYTINACSYAERVTVTFNKDGKQLLTFTYDRIASNHRSVHELSLENGATSCEDGTVTVKATCLTCGAVETWTQDNRNHETYTLDREIIRNAALCGDLEVITNGCACGERINQWVSVPCNMQWIGWDEEGSEEILKCMNCGLEERVKWTQAPVEGEPCQIQERRESRYVINGTVLTTCVDQSIYDNHDMESTFEMLGETCDDGYYVNWNCTRCGESGRWGVIYGCDHHTIVNKTYHDGTGICGPIIWHENGCPCGNYHEYHREDHCMWDWISYDEKLGDTYRCVNCGMTRTGFEYHDRIDGTCKTNVTICFTYSMDGEELFTMDQSFTQNEHRMVSTFEMLGQTCEDGYYISMSCVNCDYTENSQAPWFHHENHMIGYYDLADYGLCDGSFEIYGCACGQSRHANWNFDGCSFNSTNRYDPDTGLRIRRCSKCGAEGFYGEVGEVNPDTCTYEGTFYAKFAIDGETVLDIAETIRHEAHEMYAVEMALNNPNGTCEDGWTVTMQCINCGEIGQRNGWDHERFQVNYLDLAQAGACGGYYSQYTCACGESKGVNWDYGCEGMSYNSWSELDDSYITHSYTQRECAACGLSILEDEWNTYEGDSCYGINNRVYTVTMNGEQLGTFTRRAETDRHSMEITGIELRPGAVTCEDGITVYENCRNCGYAYSYHTSGHEYLCVDSIDLTAYGSVCGGELNHYKCACGQRERYDFDADLLCDLDRKYISHWIDGVIDTSQYTSRGYMGTWSDSYTLICAVTDPQQCGLKIRMSEYWLNEGCMAVEYQTWQLGYDDATGTCQQEFTIATGDKHAYHPYTAEDINETFEDGSYMSGTLYTCPDCGSTYTYKDYYAADGDYIKRERHAENALYTVNGENQSYHYVYEYGLEYGGYRYTTLERTEYVRANGKIWWDQYTWEYDFTNGCYAVRIETDSNGGYWSYETNAHNTTYNTVTDKEPTCTQHGQRTRTWTCQLCQQITDVETWETDPIAHSWHWSSDLDTYVCYYCELESINGANGAIVLEDFTDAYGNGTEYVIGYWNRDNVDFFCSVSIVLEDAAEDQDNELYLTDIEFQYRNDEIVAVSCSKTAVQAAADAALAAAGYTGSYAIRISCVPIHAEDTLDYAITFDSQMAE